MEPIVAFLVRRAERPIVWALSVGGLGTTFGIAKGLIERDVEAMLIGVWVAGILGGLMGLSIGVIIWVLGRLTGGLDRSVQRPDLWGIPMICPSCGWRTTADGPWTRRDCLIPPSQHHCASCKQRLVHLPTPSCPGCLSDERRSIRYPGDAAWLAFRCQQCNSPYDKWGDPIPS